MDTIIKPDKQGNLTIPKSVMLAHGFAPTLEFQVISLEDGFVLKASVTEIEKKTLADFDTKIQAQLGNLSDQIPVFGDLTAETYLDLSESDRDKLWAVAFQEASQALENLEELEVENDYRPAGQRRHP